MGLILLRHTRPDVAEGTCYGRTDYPPASSFAEEAAEVLAALPIVDRILTSPLMRCTRLAEHIGAARGLPVAADPRLIEIDFGAWEGIPWAEVPREGLDHWAGHFYESRPHGGESVGMFFARVVPFLEEMSGPGRVLAVSHAGLMRAALHHAGREGAWQMKFPYGSFIELP
ncbi:alpha-ribazole phosphatase family protein [Rhodovulum sulfidophilum]|uniref:alpha-ribazole phosphatase family protein n=1 Tax=Rhodovulum sulfidophilum TaxID=35806 RepID=UPI001F43F25D|nr:alpha-ribazole phosphatase family protein [Rhodovulum sulfidophilum]MCE8440362.1 alpha-ribazole phosphatase family protein [Rhodovulum sulfidophilum]MCE8471277.1 alpha-ribazole phosphatase family protein [Rhodovulum sulfidophilum]